MKKVITFILIAALCFHVSAFAVDESQYVGTWKQETYNEETGRYSIELLHLTADHRAYYIVQVFYPGEVSIGRQAAKTWNVKGNGIHIILGENSETDAVILNDGRLGFKLIGNAYSLFEKISD